MTISASIYNPAPTPLYDTDGSLARGAKAYFYVAGTTTPLAVYHDAGLTTPWEFPIVAGANGVLPPIYLPYSNYRVRITTFAGAVIYDADNIANPLPASAGGGGGAPASQLFQTGHIIATMAGTALDGFVRMNGRTIGSASSSAIERANADTEALFKYLWNNFADSIAAVSAGRGVSANADWSANKNIIVPSMQGRVLAGVDDMGAVAAGVAQVSTTASATNGAPTITVASAAGIARTMYAIIDGAPAGRVTAVSGTTVTLDTNYAGTTGAGKAVRFSFFPDAQTGGIAGGNQSALMTIAEMATHNHNITDPGHFHTQYGHDFQGGFSGSSAAAPGNAPTSTNVTGITINNNGQGLPSSIIQPSRLVVWWIHL